MRAACVRALALNVLLLVPAVGFAQWLHDPTEGVPRKADGTPDLTAPTPRLPDGKPDLSGIWHTAVKNPCNPASFIECGLEIGGSPFALDLGNGLPGGLPSHSGMEWLLDGPMGRRHARGADRRLPRQHVDRHARQSDQRCRKDDRAAAAGELRDARNRAHRRRPESLHTAVDHQVQPGHRARYRVDRRVLSREREVVAAHAAWGGSEQGGRAN